MSAALIASCIEFEKAACAPEAISHKPTEGMHGASGEASDASKKDKKKKKASMHARMKLLESHRRRQKEKGPFTRHQSLTDRCNAFLPKENAYLCGRSTSIRPQRDTFLESTGAKHG